MIKSLLSYSCFPLLLSCLFLTNVCEGFPPAPYYTLFGMVRDQVGQNLTGEKIDLLLLKNGSEVSRTPVVSGARVDLNYELDIRLDMERAGTLIYDESAIGSNSVFSLAVLMDGKWYYPIEVSNTLTAGKGGERVHLDLNLGIDSDGDGLPDIWEQWQLFQSGRNPNAQGVWQIDLITRNGDLDGDGMSNWLEYVAGTFAGDATIKLDLKVKEKSPGLVRFEFYSIAGKFYTIEKSSDLTNWTRLPFRPIANTANPLTLYQATDLGVISAFATPTNEAVEFYRLTVR